MTFRIFRVFIVKGYFKLLLEYHSSIFVRFYVGRLLFLVKVMSRSLWTVESSSSFAYKLGAQLPRSTVARRRPKEIYLCRQVAPALISEQLGPTH
jgi:hypothetical protein